MSSRPEVSPGLAFSLPYDSLFAVGILTHELPRIGSLVWMAEDTFAEQPGRDEARRVERWRWPVLFPLRAAIRRKIVTPLGLIDIPPALMSFPNMRSGGTSTGWVACEFRDGRLQPLGSTSDSSLPIYEVVNDTRLRDMLSSDWRPERDW